MAVTSTEVFSRSPARAGPMAAGDDGRLAWPVKVFLLAVLFQAGFQLGPLFLNSVRVVVLVMVVPLFFQLISGRLGKMHLVDYCFILAVAWQGVALAVNTPSSMITQVGSVGSEFLGSYLIGRAYIRTRAQFYRLCRVLIWAIALYLPLTLAESMTGRSFLAMAIDSLPVVRGNRDVNAGVRLGLERVQGPFGHPIHFGLFCSMAVPLALFALKDKVADNTRFIWAGLMFFSAFFGLSAGVMLALVMQTILVGWYFLMRHHKHKWWALFGVTVVCYIVVDILASRPPIRVFLTYATFSPHTGFWRLIIFEWGMKNIFGSATHNITGAPIFGIGLSDWIRPHFMHSGSMDNFWLVLGVRYGVPGFLFVGGAYLWVLWKLGGRRDLDADPEMDNFRRGWMIGFVSLAFTLMTVHIWSYIYAYVFFFFGAGIWMLTEPVKSATDPDTADVAPDPSPSGPRYSRFAPTKQRAPLAAAAARPRSVRRLPRR